MTQMSSTFEAPHFLGGTGGLFTSVGTLGQLWLLPGVRDKALWMQSCHPAPRQVPSAENATVPSVWLGAVQTQRKCCLLLVHFGRNTSHLAKTLPPRGVSHSWSSAAGGRM